MQREDAVFMAAVVIFAAHQPWKNTTDSNRKMIEAAVAQAKVIWAATHPGQQEARDAA